MSTYELDTRDAFPLTLRFSKCALVVPVHPSTRVSELKSNIIAAIQALTASGHVLNEASGWEQVGGRDPETELEPVHIGIFRGVTAAAAAAAGEERGNVPPGWEPPASFQRLDTERASAAAAGSSRGSSASSADPNVAALGFRSGADQVAYLGFAPKGSNTIARPVFATPAFLDEDDEDEEDDGGAVTAGAGVAVGGQDQAMDEGEEEEGDEDDDAWKRAGVTFGGGGSSSKSGLS